jgi:cytochrome b561
MIGKKPSRWALQPGIRRRVASVPVARMSRNYGRPHGPSDFRAKHPVLIVALHWGSVLAILVAVAAMFARDAIEDTTARQILLQVHRQLGLAVLVVVGVRILVRLTKSLADHAPGMSTIMRLAARGAHVLLYGLLVALPVVGWALTSAHDIPLSFLGVIHLPKLAAADSELADTLADYHMWLAWALLASVAMHAVAALWHHFVRRDAVLHAMLPGRSRERRRANVTPPSGLRRRASDSQTAGGQSQPAQS